jgi:hypothetical protein
MSKQSQSVKAKRQLIADLLSGKIPIPKKQRITGFWFHDEASDTYSNTRESIPGKEFKRLCEIDEDAGSLPGNEYNAVIIMSSDSGCKPIGSTIEPIQERKPTFLEKVKETISPKRKQIEAKPVEPPQPPKKEMILWEEQTRTIRLSDPGYEPTGAYWKPHDDVRGYKFPRR